jgi:hypothetical protein
MAREREGEIGTLRAVSPAAHPPGSKYDRLISKAKGVAAVKTIVVYPCDETSLRGATEAAALGSRPPPRLPTSPRTA